MVTLLGCTKCKTGCSICYEMGYDSNSKRFNITAEIIYGFKTFDIDSRLNYKTLYKAESFCSSCLEGYYFEPISKSCIKNPCGPLC